MSIRETVLKNRSYRRFDESKPVARETLVELVDLGRLSASGSNKQPLKYVVSADPDMNGTIFPHLAWAGYLKDWPGPGAGERPAGYIVILDDTSISASPGIDHGIAAQSIMLGAAERGLGGCMIGAIKREALARALGIPAGLEIVLVLALGAPKETVVLEPVGPDGGIEYYRDAEGVHHVPKRSLEDCIVEL